eukprot:GHVQ01037920.1.p1 GENE.GHVQ01037920.1~~GHVQ01037920.1.p1  ORF type:complete len:265 (+),score=57.92 GHVQ01037920.1:459-1253(+)
MSDKREVSETLQDNWEDLLAESEGEEEGSKCKKPAAAQSRASSSSNAASAKKQSKEAAAAAQDKGCGSGSGYVTLDDPVAERNRQKRIVEEADEELMDDLFSGCRRPAKTTDEQIKGEAATSDKAAAPSPATATRRTAQPALKGDPIDAISVRTLKDVEAFATKLAEKIASSPAISSAWLRLFDILLKECAPKMKEQDLTTLLNKVKLSLKHKEEAKRNAITSKKKPNDSGSQMKNYKDEIELFYGEVEEEEEEQGEGFYAEFM